MFGMATITLGIGPHSSVDFIHSKYRSCIHTDWNRDGDGCHEDGWGWE